LPDEKLGMNVRGGAGGQPGNPSDRDDEGVFISKINPGGAAARDGRLKPGMRIIEVNEISLLGATHKESVHALRNSGNKIVLLVCDGYDASKVTLTNSPSSKAIESATLSAASPVTLPSKPKPQLQSPQASYENVDDDVFTPSRSSEQIFNDKQEMKRTTTSKTNEMNLEKSHSHSPNMNNNVISSKRSTEESLSENKEVEQRVIDVVRAADQIVKTTSKDHSSLSKEQKTTTVIMKKQGVTTSPSQTTPVSENDNDNKTKTWYISSKSNLQFETINS